MVRDDLKNRDIPDVPGVYFFRKGGKTLYVGKATSLRDRVRSYFAPDLIETRGEHIVAMVERADDLAWQETDSVLEAFILESALIRTHKPSYNTLGKDDKSFNYVVITKEEFPRVLIMRGRELEKDDFKSIELQAKSYKLKSVFGPFTHGKSLKIALGIIRKIFPFRDTCTPGSSRPCFNYQIGLCPGVCAGKMGKVEYAETIRNITLLLNGKKRELVKQLEHDMHDAARAEAFERAAQLRQQVAALTHIRDIALVGDVAKKRMEQSTDGFRVEGYDIAHTSGVGTLGVMTVAIDGESTKSEYRTFNVRGFTNNDVGALTEVLKRRFAHPEWRYPRLIVVDGGKGQLNAAREVLHELGIEIPVVSVVKDEHHRPRELLGDAGLTGEHDKTILLVNAEAHRMAVNRHQARRARLGGLPPRRTRKRV